MNKLKFSNSKIFFDKNKIQMKRYKIRVRIAGGRIVDIEISAPDTHAALNMARSQYGRENVLSNQYS